MYSVVLLAAVTTGGDAVSFGAKGGGCHGTIASAGCHGGGFLGGKGNSCHGGGFLGGGGLFAGKHKGGGCHGTVAYDCCPTTAPVVVAAPPVVVAPAPMVMPAGCYGSTYNSGCHGGGGGFLGMRGNGCSGGGFLGKHRGGCHGY